MFRNYQNYEVYEDGRIWSYKSNKWLKPQTNNKGYKLVGLIDNDGKRKHYLVHRVVYESVTGEPIPECYEVNHIDERKDNNMRSNLELVSHNENCNLGTRKERSAKARTNGNGSKSVGAFKNNKLIMTFPSTMEAQRSGFHHSAVGKCCNGKWTHYKGYEWRYI